MERYIAFVAVMACACGGSVTSSDAAPEPESSVEPAHDPVPVPDPEPEPTAEPAPEPQPEPSPALSCDAVPRWTASASGYAVRRGYLGFSPDGSRLAWSNGYYDPVLVELDAQSGFELSRVESDLGAVPRSELVDRDSAWQRDLVGTDALYLAASGAASALLLEATYGAEPASSCAFFDQDGSRVFRPGCDATGPGWQVFSTEDGSLETSFTLPGECVGMTASQRQGDVLLTMGDRVAYWPASATAPSALSTHEHEAGANGQRGLVGVALDQAAGRAISIAADGSVQLYRLPDLSRETSALTAHVTVANENVYAPPFVISPTSFSHDGSVLALSGVGGALEVRRSDTLELVSQLPGSDAIAIAFAADDGLLAVARVDGLSVYACR